MMTYMIAPLQWDEHDNAMTPFGEVHVQETTYEDLDALPAGSTGPGPRVPCWETVWSETNDLLGIDEDLWDTREEARAAVSAWYEGKMLTWLVPVRRARGKTG